MHPTPSDAFVYRLPTPAAARRIALFEVWRGLWKLFPGLSRFDLGDDPETEIRRHVNALSRRYERDVSADVAEWLRASDGDRVRERNRLRDVVIPRVRALREAADAIRRIVNDIPDPTPPAAIAAPVPGLVPFFDIVNLVLNAANDAAQRRAA